MSTTTIPTDNRPRTTPESTAGETDREMSPVDDFVSYVETYARKHPDRAALWCFGVGFLVGWKLKPW